jgi:PAS domain S-box-containing protein
MSERTEATGAVFRRESDETETLQRFRTLVNVLDDGIYQVDLDCRLVAVNDVLVDLTGRDREELLGEHVSVLLGDADAATVERAVDRRAAGRNEDTDAFAVAVRTADGERIPCELHLNAVVEDGVVRGAAGIVREAGDRERTDREQQLQRERDLTARVLETSPVGILVVDDDGEVRRTNDRAREILGITADERGEYTPGDRPTYDENGEPVSVDDHPFATVLETGEPVYDRVLQMERPDGERRWLRVNAAPILTPEGEVDRVVTTGEDITDMKERERELENELNEVFGRVSDAFYALDDQWRITHANERAEEMLGRSADDLRGEVLWDEFPEAAGSELHDRFREAMETQEPTTFEHYSEPLGIWAEVHAYPSGSGLSVYFRDVSERKEMERKLGEQRRQLSTLMDNVPGMVYRCRNERELPMAFVSEGAKKLTGYDAEALERGNVSYGTEIVVEADRETLWEEIQRGIEKREQFSVTYRIETADGDVRWVRNHGRAIVEDGEVVVLEGVIIDITEREEYERKLQRSERRYRTIVENFPNGAVALFDEDLRYTAAGGEVFEDIGTATEEVVGQTVRERYPPELADKFESNFRAALRGETNSFEIEFHGRHWSAYALPVEEDDGDIFRGMIMVQDITERRARQRALERSERQYRTLVENFPNGAVALVDEDLRYRTIGGTPPRGVDAIDELEGLPARKALPPALAEKLVPRYEAAFEGESGSFEHESDGCVYQFRVVPVRDEDGDVFAAMGMSQDITERKERERDLREAKTQLEAATEAGAVGTWEWNIPDDRFVAGPSLAGTFGVDPEEASEDVSLERFISSIYEADQERIQRKINDAVESCGKYEAEYRVWNADDELRWVVARGHVEADESGDPVSFPGALIDITERKRAEGELKRHKDQLETLFEVLPVGVVVADADGELVEANETAREIWGGEVFDAESVAEYDRYDIWWADSGQPVATDDITMARVLRGEEVAEPDAFEIEAANGERRIVMTDGMPIRDERGEVVRGVVTLTDVTERREYRRKLEESEQRYRTLIENFPNGGVGVFDEDFRYTLVEGTMWDDIDPDAADLEGRTIRDALPPDTADDVEPIFRAALNGETDSVVSTLGGRTYRVWATPLRDADGEITAGQSFAVDITDQLERERQLEESNERLEQFAYAASHDLQEPLRMVSSYLQLIEQRYADDFDEEGREFLAFAVDGAERMREMIDSLLAYSRVETAGDPLEPVDLNDVLDDVRTDLQVQIAERNAAVSVEDLPRVEGDEQQLRQLFQNLFSNALEYSGDEPPRVRVEVERSGAERVVSVSDEGIGIAPEDQERIFEVFQRLHTVEEHAGTGVGLALCQRIVERHGGDIWVDSEPGEGSTFRFTLPAVEDE